MLTLAGQNIAKGRLQGASWSPRYPCRNSRDGKIWRLLLNITVSQHQILPQNILSGGDDHNGQDINKFTILVICCRWLSWKVICGASFWNLVVWCPVFICKPRYCFNFSRLHAFLHCAFVLLWICLVAASWLNFSRWRFGCKSLAMHAALLLYNWLVMWDSQPAHLSAF